MEVCQVQGVTGELLSVELHEERVVLLCELPHDFVRDLHYYLEHVNINLSHKIPPYLLETGPNTYLCIINN